MKISTEQIRRLLAEHDLKITPQRITILEAIYRLGNHPSADHIIDFIRKKNPNIASGTVYNVLETLVDHKLIKRVTTDRNIMRYDGTLENHHHLYCEQSDVIDDYVDEELNRLLKNYFSTKKIEGFSVEEVTVQIRGSFERSGK